MLFIVCFNFHKILLTRFDISQTEQLTEEQIAGTSSLCVAVYDIVLVWIFFSHNISLITVYITLIKYDIITEKLIGIHYFLLHVFSSQILYIQLLTKPNPELTNLN